MADIKPCPFCGHVGLDFSVGSTYRWRVAECSGCGATTGEERIQTLGDGDPEAWEENAKQRLIAAWNRRTSIGDTPAPQSKDGTAGVGIPRGGEQ